MELKIIEIAERIRALRDIICISVEDMAKKLGITPEEYLVYEQGGADFSFTFLYNCAETFGVDIIELLTGDIPKLGFFSVVRAGEGLNIKREGQFIYQHRAFNFKNKLAEPFLVTAPYSVAAQSEPIELATHEGQEFDYVLSGKLKVRFEDYEEVLGPGDSVYYDSGRAHGMIATGGEDCTFIAVVMKEDSDK